jgi:DNA-binding beta-propeller fold protein YncE
MKWRNIAKSIPLVAAAACLWASACGGGNKANQVVVTVSPAGGTLVVTQSITLTAVVTGATDVSSTFDCSFTTTPNATTADPNPKASTPAACTTANGDVGVLSNIQNTSTTANSTATYTAPSKFPDPAKYLNLQVIITATSKADTKKSGKSTLTIDSGIRIQMVPTTATLATGETKQFLAENFDGTVISNSDLKWDVTADATATTKSVTCTPTCGTVDGTSGIYTAPATVPTQATATIFAVSKIDPARGAQAAITIVKAGNITFSGISPSVAPQGAFQQDIFLAATNATSQIGVKLTNLDDSSFITIDPARIKVIFPAGSSAASIGARVRLTSEELKKAGHFQIQVSSSNTSITVTGGPFPLDIVPNRPTLVGATPDNVQEATLGQTGGVPVTIDGGYFGPNDGPAVTTLFNFQTPLQSVNFPTARRITGFLPPPSGSNPNAGLFPLSVQYTVKPGAVFPPPAVTTAATNIAVIPDYSGLNPPRDLSNNPLTSGGLPSGTPSTISLPANSAPSGIAVDSVAGYAIVTLAGLNTSGSNTNTQNNVQFINLAGGTPTLGALAASGGNVATAVAVDDNLHVAAVVNFGSRTLSVLSIPSGALVNTVDLSGVIPAPIPPPTNPPFAPPFPYSVGVDPVSHRALVAFASTNVGLVVNLDPAATPACLPFAPQAPYCPIAYVTLATGSNPQVAFEPGARLAYVTPGGQGLLSAVSLANPSTGSVGIVSATRASNVVTIKTAAPHNLVLGNPGTVLISGLPAGKTNNTNFNGSFAVGTVLDANNFQYFQADQDDTSTCTATCLASSGIPFLTYTISPSTVGIAFNPVTRTAVLADENVTFSQISFLDPQSQSITSMTVFAGAVGQVGSGSPELGATNVAFQPFSNTAVSFNPALKQVSLLDPTALQRLAIVSTGQNATASVCAANCGSTTPPPTNVALAGALGVDSVHNLAFAVNSGSSNISVIRLGNIKTVHIQQLITPAIDSPTTPVPAHLSQAVKITSGVAPTPVGPVRILGTGFTNPSQVRLDGVALPSADVTFISSEELDVTIPVTMPNPSGPNPIGILTGPRHFAFDVVNNLGVGSNVMDFTVVEEIPIPACSGTAAAPGGVAIDELHNIALVTNTGCHQVSAISLDPANNFGTVIKAIQTGGTPTDVAVLPKLVITGQAAGSSGVAVVTNNSANTVSILDLVSLAPVAGVTDVAVGTAPSGVAINQETNLAVIANSGSNTVSTLDLTPLTASPIGTLAPATVAVNQSPIAVAIDPDRGTNGRGLAVVTTLQLNGASAPFGALDAVDIGGTVPVKNSSASISGLLSTPTGIVFDPAVSPALFYATSTQGNQITAFNPDTNGASTIKVGINPTAIAYNFQSSTILTVNALSNSISIVDSQTFRTKATLGIGGTSRFSTAIHTLTNLAVIADQANNRVLLFPVPK